MRQRLSHWVFATLLLVAGCGGGGGSGPPEPPPDPSVQQLTDASRLVSQASFGVTWSELDGIARQGHEAWLEEQLRRPPSLHEPIVDDLVRRRDAGEFLDFEEDIELLASFRRYAWWHTTITADDQLRQRVAFALSEVLVVGDTVDAFIVDPYALSTYYDVLLTHSFGNYRDLLLAVTLHPTMGFYLSHVNNRKADPVANTFPDENYAREVMQLFTIGLFELNPDGTHRLDGNGQPIPTYDNETIREYARVFTGLSFGGPGAEFGNPTPYFREPMQMFESAHDDGSKRLLGGVVLPAGQGGLVDIAAGVDSLVNHPNAGPFVGRLLIQRFVTSNPTPGYVGRVAAAFNDDGSGVRGDMKAVLRAILLDPEARSGAGDSYGKLREPVVRYVSMIRALNPQSDDGTFYNGGYVVQELARQHPLSSPSVFNFFLPAYSPAGPFADAGLVAPEFQITTSPGIVGMSNLIDFAILGEFVTDVGPPFPAVRLNYAEWESVATDVDSLLDRLDVLFLAGELSIATRAAIRDVLVDIADPVIRAKMGLYLLLISPDYAIEGST